MISFVFIIFPGQNVFLEFVPSKVADEVEHWDDPKYFLKQIDIKVVFSHPQLYPHSNTHEKEPLQSYSI